MFPFFLFLFSGHVCLGLSKVILLVVPSKT
jgi:hypothetical protein